MQGVEEQIFLMCAHGELFDCVHRQAPTTPSQQPTNSLDHLPGTGGKELGNTQRRYGLSSFEWHDALPSAKAAGSDTGLGRALGIPLAGSYGEAQRQMCPLGGRSAQQPAGRGGGDPKAPPCALRMEGAFGLLAEAPSCGVSTSSRGLEPLDTRVLFLSSLDAAQGRQGPGAPSLALSSPAPSTASP